MHPTHFAKATPNKVALIFPETGEQLTYAQLDVAANRAAHLYRQAGLKRGDVVAILANNCIDYYVAWWGAQRSGLYFNGLPTSATMSEAAYVLRDCAASLLIVSCALGDSVKDLIYETSSAISTVRRIYTLDGEAPGCETWRDALMRMPPTLIDDPSAGAPQPYSSGSTGKPKGLRHGLSDRNYDQRDPITELRIDRFGYRQDTIYLAPGPLSHTLSLSFAALTHQVGGVVVQMSRFRPALFLSLVEKYRVSLSQMVPMMFVQLLKTPADERAKFDISSLRSVVHSAAPCPPDIKRAMIAWWGPIISEFYSGSEGLGATIISSDEWLERPGSVGKPAWSVPHICDDQGHELPTGVCGVIYFDGRSTVQVLNDPARTEMMRHPVHKGWATFGDVGFLDADGYLYLKDRAAFVIQSGEHRIYPQEVEDVLIAHPAVADAAVFGAHDPEAGEQIRAIVVPLDVNGAGAELAHELLAYCRSRLAPETCPAAIEFEPSLPRGESGKLYKRVLQERDKGARRSTL